MTSIDDAEDALRSTSAKANFHRLTRLLMCGGVRLLKETFDSIHSPADLPVKLADPTIQKQLRGARLTQPERNCLYPSPGVFGKSTDFGITLIFKLFRTICKLTPPPGPRGWDDLPNSIDHSLVADLVRIKYYRNEIYGHRQTMAISDIEFVHLWRKISEALFRIATNISPAKRDEWKKSIDDLHHNPLTPDEERCIEELETWYKQDMDVKNEVERLRGTMEEKFNTLHQELTWLRSQRPVFVVIQMHVENNTQTLPSHAGYHQAARSEPMFVVPNLPEPEQGVGAEAGSPSDPEPINPPDINVWTVILSFKESVELFLRYLWCKLQLLVRNDEVGSWHVTVECSSLQILEGLWDDYRSGHLNSVAQEILITPQVLEKLGLTVMKLNTSISEDQYENGKELFEAGSGEEDRSETQSGFQARFAKAISEGSIEPDKQTDLLARILKLEHENVELKGKVEEIEGIFHSERARISKIECENIELRRLVVEANQDSRLLKASLEKISKIEKENHHLRGLVEAYQESRRFKEKDYEERLQRLEMRNFDLDRLSQRVVLGAGEIVGLFTPLQHRSWSRSEKITSSVRGFGRSTEGPYVGTKGFCQVIINRTIHEALVGEEDKIVSVFQNLGYDVDTATCTPNDDVKQLVKPIAARNYDKKNIFFCFILSNVTMNLEIENSKGDTFNVKDLLINFIPRNCLLLWGKPKVFLFLGHQSVIAPETKSSASKVLSDVDVPFPGLYLFVPYGKEYISTLLNQIKLHCSSLDLLSIFEEAKKSFYEETNLTISDPVHNFSKKVFLG